MQKNILSMVLLSFIFGGLFIGCSESGKKVQEKKEVVITQENVLTSLINVSGMTCEGCENAIQNNLSKLEGVVNVKASHLEQSTSVEYDSSLISLIDLKEAIKTAGYKIVDKKETPKELPTAMKCGAGKCGHAAEN